MSDATILMSGFLALMSVAGVAGLLHDRLHPRTTPPCYWSDAEYWHAVIMSRFYRGYGPPE